MSWRSSCSLLALGALAFASCGGPELMHDSAPAKMHNEAKTQLLVEQAERSLRNGDAAAAGMHLAEIADSLKENPRGQLALARTLIANGRFVDCQTVLAELAEILPDDPEVEIVRGTLEEARGRWDAARIAYARAVDLDSEAVTPLLLLTKVDLVLGEPGRAAAQLERALVRMPNVLQLQEALAEAYFAVGEYGEAAKYYALCLDHDQDARELRVRHAFALSLHGNHVEALRSASRLADRDIPPYARLSLGRSALMLDDPREAAHWLTLYVDDYPDDAGAWLDLARAYYLDGLGHACLEALRNCLQVAPERADAYILLGHLRLQNEQHDLALKSYLEGMRLGADGSGLTEILEMLFARPAPGDEASEPAAAPTPTLEAQVGTEGAGA